MDGRVDIMIPVDPQTAESLTLRDREEIGRAVNRILSESAATPLARAIAALKAEALGAGLTDEEIDDELAAHKAERGQTVNHAP